MIDRLFALDIRSVESPLPDGRGSAWGRDVLPNRDCQGAAATFIAFGGPKAHRNSVEDAAGEMSVRGQPAVSTRYAWDTVGSPRAGVPCLHNLSWAGGTSELR